MGHTSLIISISKVVCADIDIHIRRIFSVKKLMRIVLLLLFSIVLVSCNGEIVITLDAPQNIAIQDGVLTWDAVTDATGYTVVVDTTSHNVTATTFDLNTLGLAAGTHPVHVIATQGTNVSLPSTTVNFVVEAIVVGIPQNVAIANGIVTWSAVTGATGYTVHVGTATYEVTATTFNLTTLTLAQGNYSVYIAAKIGTDVSLSSATVSYFVGGTTLAVPQNVVITNGVVTWSAVTGASSYVVYVDAVSHPVTATTFDLKTLDLSPGDHAVFVVAKAGTDSSAASATLNYFIESANLGSLYENALALVNPLYEPDMTIDDFDEDYEYKDYMQTSQMVYAYCVAAVEMGMTEAQALDLFDHIASTPLRMIDINNVTTLMAEIDSYGLYDLSSTEIATILYELAKVVLSTHIEDLEDYIVEYEAEIILAEADLLTTQTQVTADLASVYTSLIAYASPEQIAQLDYFLTGQYEDINFVMDHTWSIANDLRFNLEFHYPYYLDYDDPYIQMFYDILITAARDNNMALLDTFLYNNPLSPLYNLIYAQERVMYAYEDLEERENELAIFSEIIVVFVDERDTMIESMAGVVDYLFLVYDTVPASMIALLDDFAENGELTMEEYFMLKDEVVSVLLTTLPSGEDFGSVYTALFTIAGAFDIVVFDAYLPYANFFGSVDHATIDIALTFIGDLDQTTVEDVMTIVDAMIIPGECVYDEYWEEWYCEDDNVDFEVAIELAVYVGNYLEAFKLEYATKFDTLDALMTSAQVKELVLMFGESVKGALLVELPTEDYEFAAMIIDEVLTNYDNLIAAGDIINAIGMNVVDEFLTTSGQMLLDLYDLMNNGSGDLNDPLFIAEVEAVLAQMVNYKAAITDELDAASIEVLLSLVRIPLKIQLLMISDLDPADIDDLLDAAIIPLTAVLDLYITFVGYLDEEVVMDVALLVNDMIIPGEFIDDGFGGYYERDTIDFEIAIELAVYVGNYLEAFKLANVAKFDAVGALFTNGDFLDLLTIFSDLFLSEMELEMDPDQFAMVSLIFAEVLADYDNIIAGLEVFGLVGSAVVDEFLSTSGQLMLDLFDLINNSTPDSTDLLFVGAIESIITQALSYNVAITDELDLASIQTLLRIVRIPLKVQLSTEGSMLAADVDLMFNVLFVPATTVIVNVLTLEKAVFVAADALDLVTLVPTWNIIDQDVAIALVVLALDDALTTINEALIFATITLVQNDILKNADVMVLNGTTAVDVDNMIAEVVTNLTDLFAEIHAIALLDFTAMTQVEIDRLHALFEMVFPPEEPPLP